MKKRHTNSHINNDNILTGLCFCGVCGARMRYHKWGAYHKIVCYSQYAGKEYMKRDPNCDNKKVLAADIESEVEDCFKRFAIKVEKGEETESSADLIESEIKKLNTKIKKLYDLYADNESDNVWELIQENEGRIKELKKQLEIEVEKSHKFDSGKVEEIKRIADIWDELTGHEKNRLLKECIEKVVITGDDIDIHFVTF